MVDSFKPIVRVGEHGSPAFAHFFAAARPSSAAAVRFAAPSSAAAACGYASAVQFGAASQH